MTRACKISAMLVILTTTNPAWAQGGYADKEMNRIRTVSIGRGHSISDVNNMELSRVKGNVPNVGQSGAGRAPTGLRYTAQNIGTASSEPTSKPFANYRPTPTVSPYLNLFREDLDGSEDFNYQTLVRPQMEQQQFNNQVSRQALETSARIQALSARADFNTQGSEQQAPTGHSTSFFNHMHFYPSKRR